MRRPAPTSRISRLGVYALATFFLITIWTSYIPKSRISGCFPFVGATEVEVQRAPVGSLEEDVLLGEREGGNEDVGNDDARQEGYVGEFAYFEPSLIGRAPDGVETLSNGGKTDMESDPKTTKYFVLEKSELKRFGTRAEDEESEELGGEEEETGLEKRQGQTDNRLSRVYISVNTCRQPIVSAKMLETENHPQLELYVSTSAKNKKPGPNAKNDIAANITLDKGAANFTVQTNSEVYIGVHAPALTKGWEGSFSYQVAASTKEYYHSYNGTDTFLFMVDTDSESALFITPNITGELNGKEDKGAIDKWLNMKEAPFSMYAFPTDQGSAEGLEHSFCGIADTFKTNNDVRKFKVDNEMTDRYQLDDRNHARGQFYVKGLSANTSYTGFLVLDGNVSMEGLGAPDFLKTGFGGQVWKEFNWKTKADSSCQVIFNLSFCSSIAYAVPSSPEFRTDTAALAKKYDDQARAYYANFTKSLAQIACNTTATAQYSLARNCTHCAEDYKTWMCSVLMPRCEDFDSPDPWLMERNINALLPNGSPLPFAQNGTREFDEQKRRRFAYNNSRNPIIDTDIRPGPYKELLPCEDLCFDIVRSCPAQLGFGCPEGPARALQYGKRDEKTKSLKCNFPGAVVDLNTTRGGAGRRVVGGLMLWVAVVGGVFLMDVF